MSVSTPHSGRNVPESSDPDPDQRRETPPPPPGPHTVDDITSHDDTRKRRLRLRLSVTAQETMRSLAGAQGISEAGLLDALVHGLESADPDWLDRVLEHARRLDAYHQNEDARRSADDTSST